MKQDQDNNISLPFFGLPRIFPFLKPYRKKMVRMVILALLVSMIDAMFPLFNR